MKFLYCASLVGSTFAQFTYGTYGTYGTCTTPAECNYSCDIRENCMGTGKTGIFDNKADKACCGAGDVDTICNNLSLCLTLPTNIMYLNDGTECKLLTIF